MKRFFLLVFIAGALTLFVFYRVDGFSLSKISGPLVPGMLVAPDSDCIDSLSQPFYYLAKGRQCFVFLSADGQTVIKFLNYRRFSLPKWLVMFPLPHYWEMWLVGLADKRRLRFESTIESFQVAIKHLRNETGIIYLHMNPGGDLPFLKAIDRGHRVHWIDLNHTAFVLQKKAIPIYEELKNRYRTSGTEALNEGLGAFVSFLQKRCALHLADDDRDVGINFGFDHGQLMLLDPGRLSHDHTLQKKDRVEREIRVASKRLRQWLNQNYPESVAFLDQQIQAAIDA
jgi:hypothetical protein